MLLRCRIERELGSKEFIQRTTWSDAAGRILAFLRITTNPRSMGIPATADEAFDRIEELVAHPKSLVVERRPNHWSILRGVVVGSGVVAPSMTDVHLATLAMEHGTVLCSHDEGFRPYVGLKFENSLK